MALNQTISQQSFQDLTLKNFAKKGVRAKASMLLAVILQQRYPQAIIVST
jgi:hypothetical protein